MTYRIRQQQEAREAYRKELVSQIFGLTSEIERLESLLDELDAEDERDEKRADIFDRLRSLPEKY